MIVWDLDRHMAKRGLTNAYQLAAFAGLTKPTAGRVLAGEPLERIDVPTLEALAAAFRVKPWSLLRHEPARPAHPSGKPALRKRP